MKKWKSPYNDLHCRYSGRGCSKEDSCYLGREKARQECGVHAYFRFLESFDPNMNIKVCCNSCSDEETAWKVGCKDIAASGECMDQQKYCPLMKFGV